MNPAIRVDALDCKLARCRVQRINSPSLLARLAGETLIAVRSISAADDQDQMFATESRWGREFAFPNGGLKLSLKSVGSIVGTLSQKGG